MANFPSCPRTAFPAWLMVVDNETQKMEKSEIIFLAYWKHGKHTHLDNGALQLVDGLVMTFLTTAQHNLFLSDIKRLTQETLFILNHYTINLDQSQLPPIITPRLVIIVLFACSGDGWCEKKTKTWKDSQRFLKTTFEWGFPWRYCANPFGVHFSWSTFNLASIRLRCFSSKYP